MQSTTKNIVAFSLIFVGMHNAHASLVELLDNQAMTQNSEAIRIGKITRTYSSWDPENKMIYTYVKLNVSETIKGEPAKEVLMRIPGGETNGVIMKVSGVAHFHQGEETMVFLRQHQGAPTVVGMAQGKYIITTDARTGKKMVSRQLPKSLEFINTSALENVKNHMSANLSQHAHAQPDSDQPIELADMISTIKKSIEEAKKK